MEIPKAKMAGVDEAGHRTNLTPAKFIMQISINMKNFMKSKRLFSKLVLVLLLLF